MILQEDLHQSWALARKYIEEKQFSFAEKILHTLCLSSPHIEITLDYIRVLIKLKKYPYAQDWLEQALLQHPMESRLQALKASPLYIQGKYSEALNLYKILLALDPSEPAYWTNAAYCCCLLSQFPQACEFFAQSESLLQTFPNNWLRNYAIALLMTKRPQQSYYYFTLLEKQVALDSEELFHFGLAADLIGKEEQARELYQLAIVRDPQAIPPLYNLSMHDQRMGKTESAQNAWRKILSLDPSHTLAKTLLEASQETLLPQLPLSFVEALFDQYSFNYDNHLKSVLEYQAPAKARSILMKHYPALKPGIVIDLGAGAGVMGRVMRDPATHMTALDCSEGMLLQAKMTQIYDSYIQADLIAWAEQSPLQAHYFTLIEVSNYVGPALGGVVRDLWRNLLPGGVIILTAEEEPSGQSSLIRLKSCARFSFQRAFFEELQADLPDSALTVEVAPIRKDLDGECIGLYVLLYKLSDEETSALREKA